MSLLRNASLDVYTMQCKSYIKEQEVWDRNFRTSGSQSQRKT